MDFHFKIGGRFQRQPNRRPFWKTTTRFSAGSQVVISTQPAARISHLSAGPIRSQLAQDWLTSQPESRRLFCWLLPASRYGLRITPNLMRLAFTLHKLATIQHFHHVTCLENERIWSYELWTKKSYNSVDFRAMSEVLSAQCWGITSSTPHKWSYFAQYYKNKKLIMSHRRPKLNGEGRKENKWRFNKN